MHLLKIGYDLICNYRTLLTKDERVLVSDLRLAIYALESTITHFETKIKSETTASPKAQSMTVLTLDDLAAKELLDSLQHLRIEIDEVESSEERQHRLISSLSLTIESLAKYLENLGHRTNTPILSAGLTSLDDPFSKAKDELEVPRVIFHRLCR